ncbi:class I adenylate-forming enzyme family protein [Gemmatimonas sp.]
MRESSIPLLPDIFDPVAWWARTDGERTAIIDAVRDTRISYRALHQDADRWHLMLAQRGVRPGDRVAILAQNRYEFLPLFFACIRAGAIIVPLNWRLTSGELARVLSHAQPALLFGASAFRALAHDVSVVAGNAPWGWVDLDAQVPLLLHEVRGQLAPASPLRSHEDTTMLLYTSGSTGEPKGVMVPHRQLLWNAVATTTGWALGPDDVASAATPFFHTGGWHVFTTPLLFRGGTVVLAGTFEPDTYLEVLARYGITIAFGVPTQFAMLQQAANWGRALPALRTFISGGAPCPPRLQTAARAAGYRLRDAYGLTECGPNCFATNDRTARERSVTVGWPIPFLDTRVADEHDRVVAAGTVGELQVRGPQLFAGYYRDATRTAEAFTDDGWLRTGDLAQVDSDGAHRICGRRKDMFISGGENVFPGEVEAALLECPQVAEVSVVGVPDEKWGEVGCAVVVCSSTDRPADGATAPALLTEARRHLAGYKLPRHFVFVEHLPRLGTGKVDRRAVLDLALAQYSQAVPSR